MTEADKELFLNLVTRIRMYLYSPLEASSVINFIHGYVAGTGNKCDFTEQLSELVSEKYNVHSGAMGWPNQIERLAQKRQSTWISTFRKITPEVVERAEGGQLTARQQDILKRRVIIGLLERIVPAGGSWFGDEWVEEWQALCAVQSNWFKQLWTRKEWSIMQAIDKLVQTDGLFKDEGRRVPSAELMQLKDAYDKVISKK